MARDRTGWGKNSFSDPGYWCFRCFTCGRKGTRDFVPAHSREREQWRDHGSSTEGLRNYLVVCRWERPCTRRYYARQAAQQAADAAQRAQDAAAGIAVQPGEPIDLDAVQDHAPPGPQNTGKGPQLALW